MFNSTGQNKEEKQLPQTDSQESEKNLPEKNIKDSIFYFHVVYRIARAMVLLLLICLTMLAALGAGIGLGYFAYLVNDTEIPSRETLQNEINDVEQVSRIVYAGGESIGDIRSDVLRTSVSYEDISDYVKQAIVATEDENFNKHAGIVPKALIRATASDFLGIGGASGGSSLTQQLVKQQILTDEQTFKRKADEILLAMRIEKYFSKEEILTAYLNVSPFGRNNRGQNIAGVEEAAQGIFGISAKELSLPQAAFIAGLPQSPIVYSPYTNTGEFKEDFSAGLERKDDVLYNMYREKYISKEEYEMAKGHDLIPEFLPQADISQDDNGYLYHLILTEAIRALMPLVYTADGKTAEEVAASTTLQEKYYELAERRLRRNGYTVHSTIDKTIYDAMQQATSTYGSIVDDNRGSRVEVGNVLMDNATGRVYGFVGGRDYATNQNNHAFKTWRPAGSTMKPLAGYGPALEEGFIGSESQLSNFPTNYTSGNKQAVRNYGSSAGNSFESARNALKKSDNIPVINLYREMLRTTDPASYMKKMSYKMLTDEYYATQAFPLGQNDVSVVEQTAAYAMLANKGVYHQGYVIESITDNLNNVIYQHEDAPVQVFSKATASILNDMMRDVITSGTGKPAKTKLAQINSSLAEADWVGKTGTSEYETDLWFIASTPTTTLSSWIGYDDNIPMAGGNDTKNKEFWAYLANAIAKVQPDLFDPSRKFTLDRSVIKAEVSNFTGQKLGTLKYNDTEVKVPGDKITSLYVKNAPSNTQYKFGIGGTDENYKTVWSPYIRTIGTSQSRTTSSSSQEPAPTPEENTD